MSLLPPFNEKGDLPLGIHSAGWSEIERRFGASVFWIRQGMLPEADMQEFLETWQTKRDGTRRGLLEVRL